MSQGQRRYIPSWLRAMHGWEEAPEWLLDKIEEEQGFSFLDLGITPEAAGFGTEAAPVQKESDEPALKDGDDLRAVYERERQGSSHQLSADQPTQITSEAGPAEQEQDAQEPSLTQEQSEIADWLIRLEEEASSEVETPTAAETAATGTENLPDLDEEEGEEGVPRKRSGITDWLVHLEEEPPVSDLENAVTDTPGEDTDTADWLAGLEAAEPVSDATAPDLLPGLEDKAGTEEQELSTGPEADTPAWLAELQGDGAGEDVPEWLADLDSGSGITEWLAEQKEAEAAPPGSLDEDAEAAAQAGTPQSEEKAADALTDLEQGIEDEGDARQQPATDQAADSTQIDQEAGNRASDLDLDIEDEDAADWLRNLDEGSDEQPPVTDRATSSAQRDEGTAYGAIDLDLDIEDKDVSDWLRDLDEGSDKQPPAADQTVGGGQSDEGAADLKLNIGDEDTADWLRDLGKEAAEQPPAADQVIDSGQGNEEGIRDDQMPDWLRDVDALIDEPPATSDHAPTTVQPDAELGRDAGKREEDLVLGEDTGDDQVPDWLQDLAAGEDEPEPSASPQASSVQPGAGLDREAGEREEDLVLGEDTGDDQAPDWLYDLAVGEDEPEPSDLLKTDAAQPDAELDRDEGGREESPVLDEESGDKVPDWLRDMAVSEDQPTPDPLPEVGANVPDWLPFSEESAASSTAGEEVELLDEPSSGPPAWMKEIYTSQHEVPSDQETLSLPPAEELEDKEALDWLSSLQGKGTRSSQEPTVESSGPLAGLGGVLSPEPILAIHPKSTFQPVPPVPDAHQAEAELVVRTLEMPASRRAQVSGSPGREILNSLGRWAIYGLLIATVLIAPLRSLVRLPDFAETRAFYNAIEELQPGNTVLLVFDYDASLDGTLTPQARAIIWHLQHRGLGIVLLSLTPQGTAIAADLVAEREGLVPGRDYIDLGYLPPHPASLLAFVENPIGGAAGMGATEDPAQTVLGRQLQTFSGLDMIVTVSGDHEHIRWWIEQVQTRTSIALLAAVPAGIMPYLAPYYGELGTSQVAGILGGLGPTAQYEELMGADFAPSARVSYVVQTNALILFTGVVLVSGVGSLLTARQRRDAARKMHPSPSGSR